MNKNNDNNNKKKKWKKRGRRMKLYTIKFVVRNTFSSSNFRKRDTRSEKEKERVRAWGKMDKGREKDEDERKCNTGKCNT